MSRMTSMSISLFIFQEACLGWGAMEGVGRRGGAQDTPFNPCRVGRASFYHATWADQRPWPNLE
jgi:hypothetical protein